MASPVLIPFKAEHLLGVLNRDGSGQNGWHLAVEKQQNGPAFTGIVGDTVLGCAGIILPWPGVGLAWMVVSEGIGSHAIWMTRVVRRMLRDAIRAHGLHRLEAVVLADNLRNQRWIESLGFSRENGCAQQYTADRKAAIRYEWLGG